MVQVVDEILTLSAIELSRRLHSREVTAVQLLTATLNRIDEVNPKINAIIALRKGKQMTIACLLKTTYIHLC